jgi:signal peptidase
MLINGPMAPHAGYITKGDNGKTNPSYDQQGGISYNQPVKKEWIIGVAKVRDPYLGYLSSGIGGTILIWAVVYIILLGYLA